MQYYPKHFPIVLDKQCYPKHFPIVLDKQCYPKHLPIVVDRHQEWCLEPWLHPLLSRLLAHSVRTHSESDHEAPGHHESQLQDRISRNEDTPCRRRYEGNCQSINLFYYRPIERLQHSNKKFIKSWHFQLGSMGTPKMDRGHLCITQYGSREHSH